MVNQHFATVRKRTGKRIEFPTHWGSQYISAIVLLMDWLIIAGAIVLAWSTQSLIIYLLSIPIIGSRMMALGVLMHEASHGLLFKNKLLNNSIAELLTAWPIGQSMRQYKKIHQQHHSHLKESKDTEKPLERYAEFQFPLPKAKWNLTLLLDLTGMNFLRYRGSRLVHKLKNLGSTELKVQMSLYNLCRFLFIISIGLTLTALGLWVEFLLFWVVPYVTWFQLLLRLHASAEHFGLPEATAFQTRTIKANMVERFLVFPHNMNFHCEHHLYPEVRFHQLPELHKRLTQEPAFASSAHFTKGVRGLFTELTNG